VKFWWETEYVHYLQVSCDKYLLIIKGEGVVLQWGKLLAITFSKRLESHTLKVSKYTGDSLDMFPSTYMENYIQKDKLARRGSDTKCSNKEIAPSFHINPM
jgi:hypothetical protein